MQQDTPEAALKRIEGPLRLTLIGLWAERVCRAFWPLWTLVLLTLAALAFGVQDWLPLEAAWFGLVASALGGVWALVLGLRQFHRPTRDEALTRIDARLPGQPISALRDRQAIGASDAASQAVWAAHRSRMAARAAAASPVSPDLRLASRDPYALRYVALTLMVTALMFGSLWQVATVGGLLPGRAVVGVTGPSWEGWAQPPAYTGKPALYLAEQTAGPLTLPAGTRIQLRFYGQPGALILSETVSARTQVPPASDPSQDFLVTRSGKLAIEGEGGRSWQVSALPDAPPTVAPQGQILREADGHFRQAFTASDDYGVTRGEVSIALDLAAVDRRYGLAPEPETTAPVILDLPMPMTRNRTAVSQTLVDDLSQNLLANLPVTMTFAVTDAAGQTGASAPLRTTLPGRRFFDPLAAALIEMRRDLLWNRANAPRVAEILKAVTYKPDGFIRNTRAYLRLRTALHRLDTASADLSPTLRDELAAELWQVALMVEEGDLASALERLRRAQDRLSEAIRNGASPAEIDDLMKEMREALNDYLRQQAEQNKDDPDAQTSQDGQSFTMTQDQLQGMFDKLQQLMKEGRTAEAQQLLEQLQQFMDNMKVTEGPSGQGPGSPGQQAMKDLGQTLRDQQGLADDAFRDLQNGQDGTGGQPDPKGSDGKGLAERQQELRDRINRLGRNGALPGVGSQQGAEGQKQLDRAGRAMDEAGRALREGDLPGALDRQAEAMDALREGMKQFGQALAQENPQNGETQGGQALAQDKPQGGLDPLGRAPGDAGHIGSDRNMMQGQDVYRRAQDLLDEIRRRAGEQGRPQTERNYLKRLLDLF